MESPSDHRAPAPIESWAEKFTKALLTRERAVIDVRGVAPVKEEPAHKSTADLQHKPVSEELAFLRKTMRELAAAYSNQLEGEITALIEAVRTDAETRKKLPASRAHDLRDMLSLLRNLEIKPAKGRRRDLKKIESLVEELRRIAERWA